MNQPILNHRFRVSFIGWPLVGAPLETRFQSVSGLSMTVGTKEVVEGGQNLNAWALPDKLTSSKLTLKQGMVVGGGLGVMFTLAPLSHPHYMTTEVLVCLLDAGQKPLAAWYFHRAYPTQLSTSDLSADSPSVVIDTIELTYTRMQVLRV